MRAKSRRRRGALPDPRPPAPGRGRARGGRRLALTLACLGLLAAAGSRAPGSAGAQALELTRNQFAGHAERPEALLAGGVPVPVGAERWRVTGADVLRVSSPDPDVAVVLRYEPLEIPVGDGTDPLRLLLIVIVREGARHHEYKRGGQLLRQGELVPQRAFRVGAHGLVSALAGAPGRVRELVIQDDGDVELRLAQAGPVLALEVVPPAQGGLPSGGGRPYYLGRPLRFVDGRLLATGYTDNALGALRLGEHFVGRVNALFPDGGEAVLVRGLVSAQAWRSDTLALAVEGGAGYASVTDAGATATELRVAGGVTLHWRRGPWGAALHAGLVGEGAVLELYGGWQAWERTGLVLSWQGFSGRSGLGLGAAVGF